MNCAWICVNLCVKCVCVCAMLILSTYFRIFEINHVVCSPKAMPMHEQFVVLSFDVKIIANYFLIIYYWLSKHCLRLISSSRLSHYTRSASRIYSTSYKLHCLLELGTTMHHVVICMCTCPFLLHDVVFIYSTYTL